MHKLIKIKIDGLVGARKTVLDVFFAHNNYVSHWSQHCRKSNYGLIMLFSQCGFDIISDDYDCNNDDDYADDDDYKIVRKKMIVV